MSIETAVLLVFGFVYLGMILGRIPGLALDRTGVALFGALVLMALGVVQTSQLHEAIDISTMALLFGLMVVSSQFRLSGFYSRMVRYVGSLHVSPRGLMALIIALSGILSAVLANDIVCLAAAPIVAEVAVNRKLDPVPFLLALACAANVGSAATLIGNPQNILVGQVLHLSFSGYLWDAGIPALVGLALTWLIICRLCEGKWAKETSLPAIETPGYSSWQTGKGMFVLVGLLILFLVSPWPRELLALSAAAVLLCSRHMRSREMLGLVDWQLLVLFLALFIVNYAVNSLGIFKQVEAALMVQGIDLRAPLWLFIFSTLLSNLVSNVPAVMLLLPSATHPLAGPVLALSSTLAGNLLIVGSIANIIVIDQAARMGIKINWKQHARIGVPVTLATLAFSALWLWLRAM